MAYEVENKHPAADLDAVRIRLAEMNVEFIGVKEQTDLYYNHPARDFSETDEALRIRRSGDKHRITYKGPKIDQDTKTRREIELPLVDQPKIGQDFGELLEALGFRPVAKVHKRREGFRLAWRNLEVEGALDEVEGLGTFVELEVTAEEEGLSAARECIQTLAAEIQLGSPERRSYLEMLLEQQS